MASADFQFMACGSSWRVAVHGCRSDPDDQHFDHGLFAGPARGGFADGEPDSFAHAVGVAFLARGGGGIVTGFERESLTVLLDRKALDADFGGAAKLAVGTDGDRDRNDAVDRNPAAFVDRDALGCKDDVAVEQQPPGAFVADDLWTIGRKADDVAVRLD